MAGGSKQRALNFHGEGCGCFACEREGVQFTYGEAEERARVEAERASFEAAVDSLTAAGESEANAGRTDGVASVPSTAPALREAVKRLLLDGKWHTIGELAKVGGIRYGARIFELRREGLQIDRELRRETPRVYAYRLTRVQGVAL